MMNIFCIYYTVLGNISQKLLKVVFDASNHDDNYKHWEPKIIREKYCLDLVIDKNQWDKWKVMKKNFKARVK